MDARNTLSILAEELGKLLAPLEDALSSSQNFTAFMRELGWDFQLIPAPLQALASPVRAIGQQAEQVASDPSKVQDLIGLLKSFFDLVEGLENQAPGQFPPTIDVNEFRNDFPG